MMLYRYGVYTVWHTSSYCISRDPGIRGTVVYRYIVCYMCRVTCMYISVICVYVRDGIDMLIQIEGCCTGLTC